VFGFAFIRLVKGTTEAEGLQLFVAEIFLTSLYSNVEVFFVPGLWHCLEILLYETEVTFTSYNFIKSG
jgi:hypothetical protein